jgi:hypothetical protein
MTLIEIFDCLRERHVTRIEFDDGSVLESEPLLADLVDGESTRMAGRWIEASEEGLALHWNAAGAALGKGKKGGMRPLSAIRSIV